VAWCYSAAPVLFRTACGLYHVRPQEAMDPLDQLVVPEAIVGCVLGLLAAGLIHWIAPAPEPIVLEEGLVAAGFIGGLVVDWLTERRRKDRERR
jgi:hypothetical protein